MDIVILKIENIIGDKKLSIFNENEIFPCISDFAHLLGLTDESYWTSTMGSDNEDVCVINLDGIISEEYIRCRDIGCRPAILLPSSVSFFKNVEIEFGEYPQNVVSNDIQIELEKLYYQKKLNETGKKYTTDSKKNLYEDKLVIKEHIEYEYNNEKYIRIKVNFNDSKVKLSNGIYYSNNDYVWIKVEPIIWLIDHEKNIAVSKNILFSGVRYKDLMDFLKEYFIKDIILRKNNLEQLIVIKEKLNETYDIKLNIQEENGKNK